MKKLIFAVLFGIILSAWAYVQFFSEEFNPSSRIIDADQYAMQEEETLVFIPYWTLSQELTTDADTLLYFGITIDETGIDEDEEGYSQLEEFARIRGERKSFLVLRLLNVGVESRILSDAAFQRKVARDTVKVAKDYGFQGIVVDLETSAFGFASTEEKITAFYENFTSSVADYEGEMYVTLFGDTYYRGRPYDTEKIAGMVDGIIVMAYDFHKARLNPGPTFPLSDKARYGYSFAEMVDDFLRHVPHEKLIVAPGYFGYDWTLDDSGTNIGIAESLSTSQGVSRFLNGCGFERCEVKRNKDGEPSVRYVDAEGNQHEVWFEDEVSIERKRSFLETKGIRRIAPWAYSFYESRD